MGLGISSLRLGLHARGSGAWFNPDSVGSFDFDFANGRYYYNGSLYDAWSGVTGASAATFTRASSGLRWTSGGVLSSETTDVLRFNHDPASGNAPIGVLIEPAATNLLVRSQEFDNASWTKSAGGTGSAAVVTANAANGPDGTSTADQIVLNKGAGSTLSDFSLIQQQVTPPAAVYTRSIYLRTTSGSASIALRGLGTVSEPLDYEVISVSTTWQRFDLTLTATAALNGLQLILRGTYGTDNSATIIGWGAQLEAGSVATSHVPTTGSTAARAADALSIVLPTGTHDLTFTFDDDSTQAVTGQTGTYNVPTNLNRPNIKRVWGVLA